MKENNFISEALENIFRRAILRDKIERRVAIPIIIAVITVGAIYTVIRPQAEFEVKNLSISKPKVAKGEPVTIQVEVTNFGNAKGTYTVKLDIEGEAFRREVMLEPKESKTVNFDITKQEVENYGFRVEELSGSFEVVEFPLKLFEVKREDCKRLFGGERILFKVKEGGMPVENARIIIDNYLEEKTDENGVAKFRIPISGNFEAQASFQEYKSDILDFKTTNVHRDFGPSIKGIQTLALHPDFLGANYIEVVQWIGVTLEGGVLAEEPIRPTEWVKRRIESAHEQGKKVLLVLYPEWYNPETGERHSWGGQSEKKMGPVPNPKEVMKKMENVVLNYAEMAENMGVEMLSPTCELNFFVGWKNMRKWHRTVMPKIREVYSGSLIPKNNGILWKKYGLRPEGDLSFYGYFRYYDYASADLFQAMGYEWVHGSSSLEEYGKYVSKEVSYLQKLKEKYNLKGVILGPEIGITPSAKLKCLRIKLGKLGEKLRKLREKLRRKNTKESLPPLTIEEIRTKMLKMVFKNSIQFADGYFFWNTSFIRRKTNGKINKESIRTTRKYFTGRYLENKYGEGFSIILKAREMLSELELESYLKNRAEGLLIKSIRNFEGGNLENAKTLARKSLALIKIADAQESMLTCSPPDEIGSEKIKSLRSSYDAYLNGNISKSISSSENIINSTKFQIDGLNNEWDNSLKVISDPLGDSKVSDVFDISSVYAFSDDEHLYIMVKARGQVGFSRVLENYPDCVTINLEGGANLNPDIPDYKLGLRYLVRRAEPKEAHRVKSMWDDVVEFRVPLKYLNIQDNSIRFNVELSSPFDRTKITIYKLSKPYDYQRSDFFIKAVPSQVS